MRLGQDVRVINRQSEFYGKTGTVDSETRDGWVLVSFHDEAVPHPFRAEELRVA
jgi:hypothetical protein